MLHQLKAQQQKTEMKRKMEISSISASPSTARQTSRRTTLTNCPAPPTPIHCRNFVRKFVDCRGLSAVASSPWSSSSTSSLVSRRPSLTTGSTGLRMNLTRWCRSRRQKLSYCQWPSSGSCWTSWRLGEVGICRRPASRRQGCQPWQGAGASASAWALL